MTTGRSARYARAAARWGRLALPVGSGSSPRVFYGHDRVPGPDDPATGGSAKVQKLATRFPNSPGSFTVLYLGSSWLPRDLRPLLWLARRRRAPIVVNQDGVGYPAWAGSQWEDVNRPLRRALLAADHVLYQSAFAKADADRYLGAASGTWELLPNAVDTTRFTPAPRPPTDGPVVLLAGDQTSPLRLDLGLRTFALVVSAVPGARLVVTGRVPPNTPSLLRELGLEASVELVGRYTQRDAPALYQRAHLLLHTKVNDPCPNVVLEAMASGLPVVHPASGGTVELVGPGGVGVPHRDDREHLVQPSPEAMADAVRQALASREELGVIARRRAVESYALDGWLTRHEELFTEVLDRRARRPAT